MLFGDISCFLFIFRSIHYDITLKHFCRANKIARKVKMTVYDICPAHVETCYLLATKG